MNAVNPPYTDTRLRVVVTDVNDKQPKFEGLDETLKYSTAVSDETLEGDVVITVFAFDLDSEAPNNVVSCNFYLVFVFFFLCVQELCTVLTVFRESLTLCELC